MLPKIQQELKNKVNDDKLVENLFSSYQKISDEYVGQKPVDLLQNLGLFVESALRMAEHFVLGSHTSLNTNLNINACVQSLEQAQGADGLRIHLARLSRAVYDFRSRKKSVHLKDVDPLAIDAALAFSVCTWILIEILKQSSIPNPEEGIKVLFTRKVPLVQSIGGILRTTDPKLKGTHRILLLLYSSVDGLAEEELFEGTKQRIKNLAHLRTNLKNMTKSDLVHQLPNAKWTLFGRGFVEAEIIIGKNS